jgi:CheY-like chemotaxis protein/Tfp pilus assembly protein PilZ
MKKILLVDDVKLLIEIQKKFLDSSYVNILTANDGAEALEAARRERPDLIIMDKYMPVMDGLTCCRQLKGDPALAHIPVIMSTNAMREADTKEYMAAGCADILSKPIDRKLFLNAIKKHIPDIERRSIRIPLQIEMQMCHNGASYKVPSENLSLNGLFVITNLNVSINDEVNFVFVIPGRDVPMEIKGRVVWQRKSGKDPGFGVEFMEVTGQGISMLRVSELRTFLNAFNPGRTLSDRANC